MVTSGDDPMTDATADLMDEFVDLPPLVLYDLALGPMVRLVATGRSTTDDELRALRDACWRAWAFWTDVASQCLAPEGRPRTRALSRPA